MRTAIGWPALPGTLSANIVGPGAGQSMLHADQIFVPDPWPTQPQGITGGIPLNDRIDTGAAAFSRERKREKKSNLVQIWHTDELC